MRHGIWIAGSIVGLALASCGESTDLGVFAAPDGGGGVTAEAACTDIATAYCKRIGACAPILISFAWGDEATCVARVVPSCTKGLAAGTTGATPARYETCAADLMAADCPSLLSRNTPASCRPTGGKVTAGGACGDDWQCESGFCAIAADSTCGTCSTRATAGSACASDEACEFGLNCSGPDGAKTCVAQGMAGATCDDNHPCASPNVCIGKTLTAAGTCGPGAPPGGACEQSGCDFAQGLFCHPQTKVCQKIGFVMPGEPCGVINNGLVGCTGSTCLPPGQLVGTCGAVAGDGAACNDTAGPRCKAGAKCVGGTCVVPDPSSCK
jgi:hypothetical protein